MEKLKIAIITLVLGLMCGCTQNDGNIGDLFGSWSLVGITEDGNPLDSGDDTVFSFQNEVVKIVRLVDPPYSTVMRFGNFVHTDSELILKFQSAPTASGSYMYMAPEWLYFPKNDGNIAFRVLKLSGSEMVLSLEKEGKPMVYAFRKTW